MLTDEQKARRSNGIGASDSPIIMGLSTYKTPYQLYLEKIGAISADYEETELQYWGNQIEPLILQKFAQENDVEVVFPDTIYHPDHEFIFANLDGYIPSLNAIVEAKCANSFQRKQWDMAADDGIPKAYLIQIAKQCAIKNADRGYCAVLLGGYEYKQFVYERDLELEKLIIDSDIEFWNCVLNRQEPVSKNCSDSKLKYRNPQPDSEQFATYGTQKLLEQLSLTKSQIKNHQETEENLKMKLMEHMGNSEYLIGQYGEILATWKATKKGNRVFNIK